MTLLSVSRFPSARPTAQSRDSLMRLRNGYAAAVTGGYDGDDYWVTTTATSGAGSLPVGLQTAGPLTIRPHPSIYGQTITSTVASQLFCYPHKTLDFRGSGVKIAGVNGITASTNASEKGNIIIAGLTFDGVVNASGADGIRISNDVTTLTMGPIWVHQCTATDVWDGLLDFTCVTNGVPDRLLTVDWCAFGPNPGPLAIARLGTPVPWDNMSDNSVVDGKGSLLGANSDGIVNAANALKHKVTWHHNYSHGTIQRNPFVRAAHVHIYNCYIKNFGAPYENGAPNGKGIDAGTHANVLVEGTIVGQYAVGEAHESDGTLVTHPATDALFFAAPFDGLTYPQVKQVDCVFKSGLTVKTQNEADVVVPSYDYTVEATDSTDFDAAVNVALRNKVAVLAGAH